MKGLIKVLSSLSKNATTSASTATVRNFFSASKALRHSDDYEISNRKFPNGRLSVLSKPDKDVAESQKDQQVFDKLIQLQQAAFLRLPAVSCELERPFIGGVQLTFSHSSVTEQARHSLMKMINQPGFEVRHRHGNYFLILENSDDTAQLNILDKKLPFKTGSKLFMVNIDGCQRPALSLKLEPDFKFRDLEPDVKELIEELPRSRNSKPR